MRKFKVLHLTLHKIPTLAVSIYIHDRRVLCELTLLTAFLDFTQESDEASQAMIVVSNEVLVLCWNIQIESASFQQN